MISTTRNFTYSSSLSPNGSIKVPFTSTLIIFKVQALEKRVAESKYSANDSITYLEVKGNIVNDGQV